MASAVPISHRLLPTPDALIQIDPVTREPLQVIVHPSVDQGVQHNLHQLIAALDMAARCEETPHGPAAPAHR